jgi:zinc-finger-containing domain
VNCQYCNKETNLVTGKEIYSHRPDLAGKKFYICKPCKAYVGCHSNTENPLGTVANYSLRKLRNEAHAIFDPIWRSKTLSRSAAYVWMRDKLGLSVDDCHIAMFNPGQCKQLIEAVKNFDAAEMKPIIQPTKKPHRCSDCRRSFSKVSALKDHIRDVHSEHKI